MFSSSPSTAANKTQYIVKFNPRNGTSFVVGDSDSLRLFNITTTNTSRRKRPMDSAIVASSSRVCMEKVVRGISLGEEHAITPTPITHDIPQLKCLAWSLFDDAHIAVGVPGRVLLCDLREYRISPRVLTSAYSPGRTCQCLAWDPLITSRVAACWSRMRSQQPISVWDFAQPQVTMPSGSSVSVMRSPRFDVKSPLPDEMSVFKANVDLPHDCAAAISWSPYQHGLLASVGQKQLRLFSVDEGKATAQSKDLPHTLTGVCFDPHCSMRLATHGDEIIKIWDMRNLSSPLSINYTGVSKSVIKQLDWCPSLPGVLACITNEREEIRLWHCEKGGELEIYKEKSYPTLDALASFSWHPNCIGTMLTITPSGIIDMVVCERAKACVMHPTGQLSFTDGSALHWLLFPPTPTETLGSADISVVMHERAKAGYSVNIPKNIDIVSSYMRDETLINLWEWLRFVEERAKVSQLPSAIPGCNYLVNQGVLEKEKEVRISSFTLYRSRQRLECLELCGWTWGADLSLPSFSNYLGQLESQGEYERAAAIAVFNIDIQRAIFILNKGSAVHQGLRGKAMQLAAIALAGFQGLDESTKHRPVHNSRASSSPALWRDTCEVLCREEYHLYLRAMMTFLLRSPGDVIKMTFLKLLDRTAVACCYLDDSDLQTFFANETAAVKQAGVLEGIILTGFSKPDVIILLQSYIDRTGDIQTATLVGCRSNTIKDPIVSRWLDIYRDMLDRWRLWHERAFLDVVVQPRRLEERPTQQVVACCAYCTHPLPASALPNQNTRSAPKGRPSQTPTKVFACPDCRKPLPPCAVCQMPLACIVYPDNSLESVQPLGDWLTWCQSCSHGGHASHILSWFASHTTCPVTGCKCHCNELE
ncbi:GATOR complex protein MIOS [Pelomyxa schiedti]|nr:GATOR complex protein MIOS [Pelomyxa schiedti]